MRDSKIADKAAWKDEQAWFWREVANRRSGNQLQFFVEYAESLLHREGSGELTRQMVAGLFAYALRLRVEPFPPLLVELADISGDYKFASPEFEEAQWQWIVTTVRHLARYSKRAIC